jgi:hypothetical protein
MLIRVICASVPPIGMVAEGEPAHGKADRVGVCIWRDAEGFVPAELRVIDRHLQGVRRAFVQDRGEECGPGRRGRGTSC